jgi:hypothetical protein
VGQFSVQIPGQYSVQINTHPLLGAEIVSRIPRLEEVANNIMYQHKNFDGSGFPRDNTKGPAIPVGSRILRAVVDFDRHLSADWSETAAIEALRKSRDFYDPAVLDALEATRENDSDSRTRRVRFSELVDSMTIQENVTTSTGLLLVCSGQPVTAMIRQHLKKFAESGALVQAILVSDRAEQPAPEATANVA